MVLMAGKSPGVFTNWLNKNFRKESTKKAYKTHMKRFLRFIYSDREIVDLEDIDRCLESYINSDRDLLSDLREFAGWMREDGLSPKTENNSVKLVKMFMEEERDTKVGDGEWSKFRRRHLKNAVPVTEKKYPDKDKLREILTHVDAKGRSLFLFLLSSGCRIGEALQLGRGDLHPEEDPPEARLRVGTTKNEMGVVVFFSFEARDAIKEWLKIKDGMKKGGTKKHLFNIEGDRVCNIIDGLNEGNFPADLKDEFKEKGHEISDEFPVAEVEKGKSWEISVRNSVYTIERKGNKLDIFTTETYGGEKVWPMSQSNARTAWNGALEKAGHDDKDPESGHHLYHIHTLRKFFRNKLDVNRDVVETLMNHEGYLDKNYRVVPKEEAADAYREAMSSVEIFREERGVGEGELNQNSLNTIVDVLTAQGVPNEEIGKVVASSGYVMKADSSEQFKRFESPVPDNQYEELRKELLALAKNSGSSVGRPEQRFVSLEEGKRLVESGEARFLEELSDGEVVVEML